MVSTFLSIVLETTTHSLTTSYKLILFPLLLGILGTLFFKTSLDTSAPFFSKKNFNNYKNLEGDLRNEIQINEMTYSLLGVFEETQI